MCHPDAIMGGAGEDVRPVEEIEIPVGSERMQAYLSHPAGSGPWPALMLIPDIMGAGPFYQEMAGRLAHEGYLTAVPEIFFRLGPLPEVTLEHALKRNANLTHPDLEAQLSATIDYLQARPDVEPKSIGTLGFCLGGSWVIVMSARRPDDIAGGAIFYGFPVNARPTPSQPISPIDEVATISSPLIGFWGDQDAGVGMDNVERFQREMERQNKDFVCTIYPGAGHAFMSGRTEADSAAEKDAWPNMLQFFDRTLRAGSLAG
jgi:carboxymethylenebutenolidase